MSVTTSVNSLKLRRPKEDDIPEIEDIAREYSDNPLPDKFVHAAVIEENDDIIAFGILRSNMEAILYCAGSNREKVASLKLLIEQAVNDAKKNFDDIYVFAQDEQFAKILEKHFNFRRAKGIAMILDINK